MNPAEKAKQFSVAKLGDGVGQIYWRSQLEEAWLAGHSDGVSFREWAEAPSSTPPEHEREYQVDPPIDLEAEKKKKSKIFSDKNRAARENIDPTTGERVELKTKKQTLAELDFELDL